MGKIDIGLSMLHCLGEPFTNLCKRLRTASVNHVELVDDGWHSLDQERVKTLAKIAEDHTLVYTLHSPFADINIAAPAEDMRNFVMKRLSKSMGFAGKLECRIVVFHPGFRTGISDFYPGMDWEINIESVRKLLRLAKKHEVNIAIENCPDPFGFLLKDIKQFSRFFTELGEDVDLVLDVGHSNINSQTHAFIESFGDRIVHIHAHDNNGEHDQHLGIGLGSVDWRQFREDIETTPFSGLVMVESIDHLHESITTLQKLFT